MFARYWALALGTEAAASKAACDPAGSPLQVTLAGSPLQVNPAGSPGR